MPVGSLLVVAVVAVVVLPNAAAYVVVVQPNTAVVKPAALTTLQCHSSIRMMGAAAAPPPPPLSAADEERLLLSEEGLNAFINAEMRDFLEGNMAALDKKEVTGWKMSTMEKLTEGFIRGDGSSDEDLKMESGAEAVGLLCATAYTAFSEGFRDGVLSQLGSAISYFRNYFREDARHIAACERVGLSDYAVAHHISDMYHHRVFRGTYTKTLAPSAAGKGEAAAREAMGLPPLLVQDGGGADGGACDGDECVVWGPNGLCLQTKREEEQWRKRRFEKVQMEGTRDPRRGGSGSTR